MLRMRDDRDPYPRRPDPWRPPNGPAPGSGFGESMAPWLASGCSTAGIVMLNGPLTSAAASQAAAALLTLDALGTEPVQLHLSAPDGDLNAAFAIVDAVDAMRAPLHATVTGEAGGAAIAVLAAAGRRWPTATRASASPSRVRPPWPEPPTRSPRRPGATCASSRSWPCGWPR
jgi:hypothetical protein